MRRSSPRLLARSHQSSDALFTQIAKTKTNPKLQTLTQTYPTPTWRFHKPPTHPKCAGRTLHLRDPWRNCKFAPHGKRRPVPAVGGSDNDVFRFLSLFLAIGSPKGSVCGNKEEEEEAEPEVVVEEADLDEGRAELEEPHTGYPVGVYRARLWAPRREAPP